MKFDIPDNKKLVFETLIPIRWGDMDAMGHVNNTTYYQATLNANINRHLI